MAVGATQNHDTWQSDFALVRYTAAGALDGTFGTGGKVTTSFGSDSAANAVLLQPDGRLVVTGGNGRQSDTPSFALVRYNRNGSLDRTFAGGGHALLGFPPQAASAQGIARGKNGQFLVVGGTFGVDTPGDFALARFNADGRLDRTFGAGGQVTTALTAPIDSTLSAVVAQRDGKLLVVGQADDLWQRPGILRLNKDGSRDTTFGTGGQVLLPIGTDRVQKVLVQPDGKVLVVETNNGSTGPPDAHLVLLRLNADGTPDTRFGQGGRAVASFPGGPVAPPPIAGVVVQPDGKIVVGISAGSLELVRFTRDGRIDTGFGSDHTGWVTTALAEPASLAVANLSTGLALQPDGKLVMTGEVFQPDATSPLGPAFRIALARYGADGRLDRSFGTGGVALSSPDVPAEVSGVVVQHDGKIVVGGIGGAHGDFYLARFNKDGSPDRTFGAGGQALTDFGGTDTARGIALDPAGRIVLAGITENPTASSSAFAVARYSTDGRLDAHFGTGGKVTTSFARALSLESTVGMTLGPQGTVVVAGWGMNPTLGTYGLALAEYAAGP